MNLTRTAALTFTVLLGSCLVSYGFHHGHPDPHAGTYVRCLGRSALNAVGRCEMRNHPRQSWDQENLKRGDRGCPSAIYEAPGGELRQCE